LEIRREPRPTREQNEHRSHFAGGASGDVEKGEQFVGGAALEALGNVV
jgi:hypothetical protein